MQQSRRPNVLSWVTAGITSTSNSLCYSVCSSLDAESLWRLELNFFYKGAAKKERRLMSNAISDSQSCFTIFTYFHRFISLESVRFQNVISSKSQLNCCWLHNFKLSFLKNRCWWAYGALHCSGDVTICSFFVHFDVSSDSSVDRSVSACAQTSRFQTDKEVMTEVVRAVTDVREQEMGFQKASHAWNVM
jgi:hypothetical protein